MWWHSFAFLHTFSNSGPECSVLALGKICKLLIRLDAKAELPHGGHAVFATTEMKTLCDDALTHTRNWANSRRIPASDFVPRTKKSYSSYLRI